MFALITKAAFKQSVTVCVCGVVVSVREQQVGWEKGNIMSPPLPPAAPPPPYFTASNWTGQPPLAAPPPLGLPCLF